MADDMTIADLFICKRLGNATKLVSAYSSQNSRPTEYSNYTGIKAETVETSLLDPGVKSSGFWCSFTMTTNHTKMDNSNSSTIFIYNETSRYHVIEAYGQLTTWDLTFHDGTAVAKDVIDGFYINEKNKKYKAVVPEGTQLFKSHGTLMILAWGFFIPAGGLFAAARNLFQRGGLWFNLHRAFMIMGVLLNIAGFVVIFVEKGGFVDPGYTLGYAHAVMGCMVLGYSLMNVIRGFLRPDHESPRRRRFKRNHFIFAGLAILLSNANITIGLYMESLSASAIAFGVLSGICMLFIPIFHFWLSSDDLPMPIHKSVLAGVFVVLIANTVSAATLFLLNA